jgi:hypothetical protein
LPCVQRLAEKVSAGEESMGLVGSVVIAQLYVGTAILGCPAER